MCFILTGIAAVLLAGCKVAGLYPLDENKSCICMGQSVCLLWQGLSFWHVILKEEPHERDSGATGR